MAHGKIHIIKDKNDWEEKLAEGNAKDQVVVVDFTASWCGPCRFIAPFFAELSEKYDNMIFVKVDVDELNDISTEYDIHAMPTFLFFKKSMVVDKLVGMNIPELQKKVKQFSESCAAVVKQLSVEG